MSYVRWSTPIKLPDGVDAMDYYINSSKWNVPTSDLYIYDHVGGFVSINVSGNRHRPQAPFDGPTVIDVDPETKCGRANPAWVEWLDEGREPIDLPGAGETFEFSDMEDAIAKVEELIAAGFLAPPWLIPSMRGEEVEDA